MYTIELTVDCCSTRRYTYISFTSVQLVGCDASAAREGNSSCSLAYTRPYYSADHFRWFGKESMRLPGSWPDESRESRANSACPSFRTARERKVLRPDSAANLFLQTNNQKRSTASSALLQSRHFRNIALDGLSDSCARYVGRQFLLRNLCFCKIRLRSWLSTTLRAVESRLRRTRVIATYLPASTSSSSVVQIRFRRDVFIRDAQTHAHIYTFVRRWLDGRRPSSPILSFSRNKSLFSSLFLAHNRARLLLFIRSRYFYTRMQSAASRHLYNSQTGGVNEWVQTMARHRLITATSCYDSRA